MMRAHPAVQFDRNKLKEVILFVSSICDPSRLGAVKLHKILYFADMTQFAFEGHPITGDTYRKQAHGPTSEHLLGALRELQKERAIEINSVEYFKYRKTTYRPLRAPDLAVLSDPEQQLIRDVVDFVALQNTAKTISEFSHNLAWEMAEFGEEIPYHSAFALFPSDVSDAAIEWAASTVAEIEAERSQGSKVDYETFAAFRSRVLSARG